mgnify:CR=1 FL=1
MNSTKLLRYSMQLSMLKQLRSLELINENEYRLIEKKLKKRLWCNFQYYCLTSTELRCRIILTLR